MSRFILICLGGALGTGARYLLSSGITRAAGAGLPVGTITVNLIGSFLLGVLMQLSVSTESINTDARLIIGTGVLGGFTTYSAFNQETFTLLRDQAWGAAALNVTATVGGCLVASALAVVVVRALTH